MQALRCPTATLGQWRQAQAAGLDGEAAAGGEGAGVFAVAVAGDGGRAGDRPQLAARDLGTGQRVEQGGRVGVGRRREDLVDRPGLDQAPPVHHGDVVADRAGNPDIVGDEEERRVELGLELGEEFEDLRLHGDVECRGRLVGDQHLWVAGDRDRDRRPLAQAAGELERVGARGPGRVGEADPLEQLEPASPGLLSAAGDVMGEEHLAIWSPIFCSGSSAAEGSCGTIPIALPRSRRIWVSGAPSSSASPSLTLPSTVAVGPSSPRIARPVTDLPEPDSPRRTKVRPGESSKPTSRTTLTAPLAPAERDLEPLDREARLYGDAHEGLRSETERSLPSPSPSRLKPTAAAKIGIVGRTERTGRS